MLQDVSVTKHLVHEALSIVGAAIETSPDGVLSCSGLPRDIFGSEQRRIAFADSFFSLDEFPDGVEVISPGSPMFESIGLLAADAPLFAFASRRNSDLNPDFSKQLIRWTDCIVTDIRDTVIRRTWLFEHYFRARFFTFDVDEAVVRVAIDHRTGHIAIDQCDLSRLLACESFGNTSRSDVPQGEEIQRSLAIARTSVARWTAAERDQILDKLSGRRHHAEASLRQFYDNREAERREVERNARRRLRSANDPGEAADYPAALVDRHRLERKEDNSDMAAQMEDLKQKYCMCEIRLEHLATIVADTYCASQTLTLARGSTCTEAILSTDSDSTRPSCQSCFHCRTELTICDSGHVACKLCMKICESCSQSVCQACGVLECPICQRTICSDCSKQCRCGRFVCRSHIKTCRDHGAFCEACGPECASNACDAHVCPECVNEQVVCTRCGKAKCEKCRRTHVDCGSVTCLDCLERARSACGKCGHALVVCWKCGRPRKRCRICTKTMCHACEAQGRTCGSCGGTMCRGCASDLMAECSDCGCALCPKCGERGQCKACLDRSRRARQVATNADRLAGLSNTKLVRRFTSLLARCGLSDLQEKVLSSCKAEDGNIALGFWQHAIDSLNEVHGRKRNDLAILIERTAPLHLLNTTELEEALRTNSEP